MSENQKSCALVTGGSRGIGRAICMELAQMGMNIVVNYAGGEAAAQETAEACRVLGVQAEMIQANVAEPSECKRLIDETVKTFGSIDVLVCNAGISRDGLLVLAKEADYVETMDTNVRGAFFCAKAAAKPMMKQRSGRIIFLSSVVGLHGNIGQTIYAASKAALIGMTKSIARELAGRSITVNAVAPGYIETDMTKSLPNAAKEAFLADIPLSRPGSATDVAKAVGFLCGEGAAYITGQVLPVDGGMSM